MLVSKVYQIEINSEQPECEVIQKLFQLGFQKVVWEGEAKTSFAEVYVPYSFPLHLLRSLRMSY